MTTTFTRYTTSEEVREVVSRFETCEFMPGEFHHSDHITVAMCYLLESTEKESCIRMRMGLLRYLEHLGSPAAYHETITVFWVKSICRQLALVDPSRPLFELANDIILACQGSRLIDDYFSAERLGSDEARKKWVEPDLRSLEPETL